MLRILVVVSALIAMAAAVGTSSRQSPFGVVEGIRDCGSFGKLGTVSVTDCTQVPCHLVPRTVYDIAIRFTSQATSADLALLAYHAGTEELLLESPIDGVIEAGIEYELQVKLRVTNALEGTAFNIRFYILDLITSKIEICALAAVTIGW